MKPVPLSPLSDPVYYAILTGIVLAFMTFVFITITHAQVSYPADIPTECIELAQRENRPLIVNNKLEALKAKARLYLMKRDPLVTQCREGVKRVEAQIKAMKNEVAK